MQNTPLKSHFSKACSTYLAEYPGRVITTDKLASLVAEAWPNAFSAVNIMAGFKNAAYFQLTQVSQLTDKLHLQRHSISQHNLQMLIGKCLPLILFSPEKEALYRKRYEEKYEILDDPSYVAWLKINHPKDSAASLSSSSAKSGSFHNSPNSVKVSSTSDLSEVLVLPRPVAKTKTKSKPSLNKKAICITDDVVLEELKQKEDDKKAKELKKMHAKQERERKNGKKQKKSR